MTRLFNALLLIATIVGVVFAVAAQAERDALQREFNDLAAKYGHMPIEDETKFHIMRLKTEDPMHFRFRVFLPANHQYSTQSLQSSQHHIDPSNFLLQARFRYDEKKDRLMFFHATGSGSGLSSRHSGGSARFIVDNWDRLEVELASEGDIRRYELDEVVTVVRVTMPDAVLEEFEQRFPNAGYQRGATVCWIRLGTDAAFQKQSNHGNPAP